MKRGVFFKTVFAFVCMALLAPVFAQGSSDDFNRAKEIELFQKIYSGYGGDKAVDGSSIIKLNIPSAPENGAVVPIEVEIDHPMQEESYISKITILTDLNRIKHLFTAHYTPQNGIAYLFLNAKLSMTQNVYLLAETNDGKIFTTKKEITVATGSCVEGKKTDMPADIVIKRKDYYINDTKKDEAPYSGYKEDEIVKIVTYIEHKMETGFRKDKYSGELKPEFFIKKATVFFEDNKVAAFEISPIVSKNPTIIFPYKINKEGSLKVVYENNKDEKFETAAMISPKSSGWW